MLTRLPVQLSIHPVEAVRIVTDNIPPHFEAIPIGKKDYIEALRVVGNGGWSGAKIYDALLMGCAARCGADRIYTFNLAGFPAADSCWAAGKGVHAMKSEHRDQGSQGFHRRHFATTGYD